MLTGVAHLPKDARFVRWSIVGAVTIELFNRQSEAYAEAATNVRLRLTVNRKHLRRHRLEYNV